MFLNEINLHNSLWQRLMARRTRLPHALLLAGPRGLGKFALAQAFASGLLCEQPGMDGRSCGTCIACGWMAQGNHPDFRLLQPEALAAGDEGADEGKGDKKKASQQITIDQVRELDDFLNVGTHRSGLRVILVHPAEAMNRSTANALLKSLEEPGAGTVFLLVSDEPKRLLPTIRSRCQFEAVAVPKRSEAQAALQAAGLAEADRWLALAGGAPYLALELAAAKQGEWMSRLATRLTSADIDVHVAAAELDKMLRDAKGSIPLRLIVDYVQRWTVDLTLTASGLPVRYFVGQQDTIMSVVRRLSVPVLVGFYRRLVEARRQAEQPLNGRLFLENLFLDYRSLFANNHGT